MGPFSVPSETHFWENATENLVENSTETICIPKISYLYLKISLLFFDLNYICSNEILFTYFGMDSLLLSFIIGSRRELKI